MRTVFAITAVFAATISMVSAHCEMTDPPPFASQHNKVDTQTTDFNMNAPLAADGSNFPCRGHINTSGSVKTYQPGDHTITIVGGAVHGGGSCQVAVSYVTDPGSLQGDAATEHFKVITSLEGGCPSGDFPGNAPNAQQSYTISFTIPSDAKGGDVILSWSWFNKIGNREMYQNCAKITIDNPSGTNDLSSNPHIFRANSGGAASSCHTVEGTDLTFPASFKNGATLHQAPGSSPGASIGDCGDGGAGGSSPVVPSGSFDTPTSTRQNLVNKPTTTTTVAAARPTTLAKVTTTTAAPPAATTTSAPSKPIGGANPADCVSGSVICQPGEKTWKMCGDAQNNVFDVPPGTVCKNGVFEFAKRDLANHRARHLRGKSLLRPRHM